jgi:tetratricopeptide (TPR) repeat protein
MSTRAAAPEPEACPDRDVLALWNVGNLPPEHREVIEAHIRACPQCVAVLEGLDDSADPMLADLRRPLPPEAQSTGELQPVSPPLRVPARPDAPARTGLARGRRTGVVIQGEPGRHEPWAPESARQTPPRAGDTADADEPVPDIAGYEILGELGRGGVGVVYQARQVQLNRLVAIKMLLAGEFARPHELARFRAEAEAVAALKHPHIVQIYEFGEQAGRPYFSLEFMDGGSLAGWLQGTPQAPPQAARLLEALARGVAQAHEHGIIHRDLKPGNVLLARSEADPAVRLGTETGETGSFEAKITDFGVAKHSERRSGQTRSGAVLGTPCYMAPEQASGQPEAVGPAADIYGLGAILYEVLTGRPPFRGSSVWDTLDQVRTREPLPPTRLQPGVPRDLETICLKCLQKEPKKRYASSLDLAEDLHRFLKNEPIRARPAGVGERTLKWAKRRPAAAAAVGVGIAAALGLAVLGWLLMRTRLEAADMRANMAEQERNRESKTAEERIQKEKRLAEARILRDKGRNAFAARDFDKAVVLLETCHKWLASQAESVELKQQVSELLTQARSQQAVMRKRRDALKNYKKFNRLRDETLFSSLQVSGLDRDTNVKKTRAAAGEALELFGLPQPAGQKSKLDLSGFDDGEMAQIREDCYELFLLWADAEAQSLPGEKRLRQAGKALVLLDHAAELGWETKAYYLLRGKYLALMNNQTGARRARAKAGKVPPGVAGDLDYFLLGIEAYQGQDVNQATAWFEQAFQRNRKHFWAAFYLSQCCLKAGHTSEAKVWLDYCQNLRPDYFWVYLLRGFVQSELGAKVRANSLLAKAKTGLPALGVNTVGLIGSPFGKGPLLAASALFSEGITEVQAAAHFLAAWDDYRAAEKRQLKNEEEQYALLVHRGFLRIRQGLWRAAAEELRHAIRLKPNQYQAYQNLAWALEQQDNVAGAIAALGKAIEKAGPLASLYRARARLTAKRDPQAALLDLDRAIQHSPAMAPFERATVYLERGLIRAGLHRYREAIADYDAALKVRPSYVIVLPYKAWALMRRKPTQKRHYQEALACLNTYLLRAALGLKNGQALQKGWLAALYRLRASAHLALKERDEALEDYTQALKLEPHPEAYRNRGWLYIVLDAPHLALRDFNQMVRRYPAIADAYNGRGNALVKLFRCRQAVAAAEQALRLGPHDHCALYKAARIYAQASVRIQIELSKDRQWSLEFGSRFQKRAEQLLKAAFDQLPGEAERLDFYRHVVRNDLALKPIRGGNIYRRLAAIYDPYCDKNSTPPQLAVPAVPPALPPTNRPNH